MSLRFLAKRAGFNPVHWCSLGFGSGLSPVAPGTFGTLVGVLFAWLLIDVSWQWQLGIVVLAFVFGVWATQVSAKAFGSKDPGAIVWDEIVAQMLVLIIADASVWQWVVGFCAFRLFDIIKPWPIRDLDHSLHGGLGIMLDDILAAIYAMFVLWGCQLLF